ncbi:GDP-mannose 4,6-dehydratase [Paenibacillus sp. PDC88]|uniref:GDP-mannose 4,6-dehydratase n=1 Tax=Paenibacillus sp. PDC88 TaxID=1884375 RepID=UPI0008946073|nr:GDP-mannose 4,6-dehydratase [Paenibacillus sp. PDC88]SDW82567.1 GDP-4-dehydro-6-deoxy-D-mannose reductase [Paenibacillus sp. PDC88]
MRALITGVNGFVGKHLEEYLLSDHIEVWGTTRNTLNIQGGAKNRIAMGFSNEAEMIEVLNHVKPDMIFHLAAQSSVRKSWDKVVETLESNVISSANFYEAIRKSDIGEKVRILSVGSSEEYGMVISDSMPINEECALNPISPYGISKVSQYMLAKMYMKLGLQIVHVRPFNHIGPGQDLGFVTSDFSHQIAKIELGMSEQIMKVGNLSAKRDFLDVRDIIRAYSEIIRKGIPGEAYNICSGEPVSIADILTSLVALSDKEIDIVTEPSLLRAIDIPLYIGSNKKITSTINWKQHIGIEETLGDVLNYWRNRVKIEGRV